MNVIKAAFGGSAFTKTQKVFQWDGEDKLVFVGIDLPESYQVHFSNSLSGESKTALGTPDGVMIPPEYFVPGSEIYAWIWLSGDVGGYTKYQVTIPVYRRAQPTDVTPTPAQKSALDQAIDALNDATEAIPAQIDTALEEAKESGEFDGEDGKDGNAIWTSDQRPIHQTDYGYPVEWLSGRTGEPALGDLIVNSFGEVWQVIDTHWISLLGLVTVSFVSNIKGDAGPAEVFWATYNTTTEAEITAAVTVGKAVLCKISDEIFYLVSKAAIGPSGSAWIFASANQTSMRVTFVSGSYWNSIGTRTIPTKTSDLTNDSGFVNASGAAAAAPVQSVNGQTGAVTVSGAAYFPFTISDSAVTPGTGVTPQAIYQAYTAGKAVFAVIEPELEIDDDQVLPLTWINELSGTYSIWFSVVNGNASFDLIYSADSWHTQSNAFYQKPSTGIPKVHLASAVQASLGKADSALQSYTETDPTVPSWAKASSKPSYTASEVGAIAAPASPASGDVLTYDGSAWGASAPSHQIPSGGNAGECLAKNSASNYDLRWRTINDWTPAGLMRTAGGTAAKVAEWSFWSATQYPAWLVVTVGNSNTYAGAITLKVNGSTAFPIYINGAASSATNYSLPAGSYFVYFDGSKFDFRTDGKIPGGITGHADQDIAAPASPSTGDFLCWNGSAWAATTLAAWQGGNY